MTGDDPLAASRGRPRNLARRRTILRAALAVFARHGYEGASMHEIAAASGIGDSLLYRYYPSKQALLSGVVASVVDAIGTLQRHLRDASKRKSSLRAFLESAGMLLVAHFEEVGDWYAVRFTGLPIAAEHVRALRAAYDGVMDPIAAAVRARTPCRDASVVARVFLGSLFTYVLFQTRAGHEPAASGVRDAYVGEVVELLIDALSGYAGNPRP